MYRSYVKYSRLVIDNSGKTVLDTLQLSKVKCRETPNKELLF